jgi:hypothetical protein
MAVDFRIRRHIGFSSTASAKDSKAQAGMTSNRSMEVALIEVLGLAVRFLYNAKRGAFAELLADFMMPLAPTYPLPSQP